MKNMFIKVSHIKFFIVMLQNIKTASVLQIFNFFIQKHQYTGNIFNLINENEVFTLINLIKLTLLIFL